MAVAGASVLAGLPGVSLAAPTAPYTALTVDLGEHRTRPVKQSGVYDPSNATMDAAAGADDVFRITASLPDTSYVRLDAAPPTGQSWTAGQTYETAKGRDSVRARLALNDERTLFCTTATGSLTVREVTRDATTQAVTAFAASYVYHCDGDPAALTGEIRWNSSVDYVAALPDPTTADFGKLDLGDRPTKSLIVRSRGSLPVTFGGAGLTGAGSGDFEIVSNYCSNRTVTVGNGCLLSVRPKSTRGGLTSAVLRLPADTVAGELAIPVRADVVDGAKGAYFPASPARLMDSRSGLGAPKAKLGPGRTVNLQVAGRGGVPASGVGAVVLNLTVTGPTSNSFLTAYPAGEQLPTASSINFAKGWLGSNNVTVKVGADGKVSIYNRNGYTDVVVDVVGFYAGTSLTPAGFTKRGQYQWFEPYRILDTRTTGKGPLPAGSAVAGWVDFKADVFGDFNPHVQALVLNITAVSPQQAGFLTAWSGEGSKPVASTVNYGAGKVVPNLAYVQTVPCPSGGCGGATGAPRYRVFTSATSHVVVDLVGVIDDGTVTDGLRLRPSAPKRIVDSRIGQGLVNALSAGETDKVTLDSHDGIQEDDQVLVMNMTAVSPEKNTVLTVWPADAGIAKPSASNLNPAAGQVVSNGVLGVLGPNGAFNVHNLSGQTPLVADLVGTFYLYPATAGSTLAGQSRQQVTATGVTEYARG
ncbi:hypothetical protein [Micromonospora purpureochromogenes]|uniref:hypothetical protein n=1 Tax=Micromonospora purpureochromogenes TaxID=47872 RepID=UPI0012FE01BA|nr:hypothetical protein [Micromonospora purpureochromogenes]